jgi:predicted CoA-binding protein
VTPINPGSKTITVGGKEHTTTAALGDLPHPKETAVSIITPPAATIEILQDAKKLGIAAIWLQPGTFDSEVIKFAREEGAFQAVVAGEGGRGGEGWCVLVDGERAMKAAGKL